MYFSCGCALDLHSTVVLLKAGKAVLHSSRKSNLHSTVVLLKAISRLPLYTTSLFTFYCSSIKGLFRCHTFYSSSIFTFYCSSIKGPTPGPTCISCLWYLHSTVVLLKGDFMTTKNDTKLFTFYCSSIKGFTSFIVFSPTT